MSLRDRFLKIRANRNHKSVLEQLDEPIKCDAGRTPPFIGGRPCKTPAELTALVHHCGRPDGRMEVVLCQNHLMMLAAHMAASIDHDNRLPCGTEVVTGAELIWNVHTLDHHHDGSNR